MRNERPLIAFFGHHKCATTWVAHFVSYVCRLTGRRSESLDNPRQYGGNLEAYRRSQGIDFLFMRNARWSEVKEVPFERGVHLIRDPRDILISAYFSHRNSHPEDGWPELRARRERLRKVELEEGLLLEMEFSASVFADIASWNYGDGRVLELRFEELIRDPYATMLRAFGHLAVLDESETAIWPHGWIRAKEGLSNRLRKISGRFPAPRTRLQKVPAEWFLLELYRNRFEKITGGRTPGVSDEKSHFRKGVSGDWKRYFTPRVKRAFEERHERMLRDLGYHESE